MKVITIAGRLTRNAELRRSQSGDPVLGFSVAVDDRSTRDKTTLFFDCSIWGKRGEVLAQYLKKGTAITVSGDFSTREHDGKTYLQVRVNDLTLQGGKSQSDRPSQSGYGEQQSSYGDAPADLNDSDLPF